MFILCIYLAPIGLQVTSVGDKPVILFPSVLVLFGVLFVYIGGAKLDRQTLVYFVMLSFFTVTGLIGSISRGGSLSPLLAMASFSLPIYHVFVGAALYRTSFEALLRKCAIIYSSIIVLVFLSDITGGSFPRGCGLQGRWGGCILGFEVMGFINASANYFVILSPLLSLLIFNAKKKHDVMIGIIAFTCLFVITLLSLSRSSSLLLMISMLSFLFVAFRNYVVVLFPSFLLLMFVFWEKLAKNYIFQGVIARTEIALENGDITTGRIDIWSDAIGVAVKSPFWGSAFGFFSDYSEFGTTHQQFLEVLFKAGALGLIIYVGFFCAVYKKSRQLFRLEQFSTTYNPKYFLNLFCFLVVVSCLFQPIISYHLFGSLLFFFSGYVIQRHARFA